jgi:hypothetical protein
MARKRKVNYEPVVGKNEEAERLKQRLQERGGWPVENPFALFEEEGIDFAKLWDRAETGEAKRWAQFVSLIERQLDKERIDERRCELRAGGCVLAEIGGKEGTPTLKVWTKNRIRLDSQEGREHYPKYADIVEEEQRLIRLRRFCHAALRGGRILCTFSQLTDGVVAAFEAGVIFAFRARNGSLGRRRPKHEIDAAFDTLAATLAQEGKSLANQKPADALDCLADAQPTLWKKRSRKTFQNRFSRWKKEAV